MIKTDLMRKFFTHLIIFILLCSSLVSTARTLATTNFSYQANVEYQVEANNSIDITENYNVVNNTSRAYLTNIIISTPSNQISGVKAVYNDGEIIPTEVTEKSAVNSGYSYKYNEIRLIFPRIIYGYGKQWGFSVSYNAKSLVEDKGSAHIVYIPQIKTIEGETTYNLRLKIPDTFGTLHPIGTKAFTYTIVGGKQIVDFNKEDLASQPIALLFGDFAIYDINFNFPLTNSSLLPQTFTITLPPDLGNQKSYVETLDPRPNNTHLDDDGNVLADYRLAPNQSLIVKTKILSKVQYLEYDLSKSGYKKDIPITLVKKYTRTYGYWQADETVKQAAAKLNQDNRPVIDNVKAMYQFVIDKLSYNKNKIKFNLRQGAQKALANPSNAVCLEYSDLLIAMLRSQGIPARMLVGYGYSGDLKNSNSVSDSLHSWVEAYVPGIGWMELDPTWGEKFDEFGYSDLDHFAFAVWGTNNQQPSAVTVGSQDQNYQYENASLIYEQNVNEPANIGNVRGQKLVLLPFLILNRFYLIAKSVVTSDENILLVDNKKIELGSLAPSQKININRLEFSFNWTKSNQVKFETNNRAPAVLLATTLIKPNYWPMGLIIALLLIIVGWLIMIRLHSSRIKIAEPNKDVKSIEK